MSRAVFLPTDVLFEELFKDVPAEFEREGAKGGVAPPPRPPEPSGSDIGFNTSA
eukprot:CAMPEP_0184561584 /NCGR_PEP_ID=MMETSP0199_2-20130426/47520_1 /TAXON_ID=1112570 /ORGANISM="Thraustochytrium sp., Strain LLF1b" /LENGTH=53 /DNA_ID=CAMNT_0026958907 /DNA_START=405 /DNA_END=566 /DNA_ORIENTATION=-